MSSDGSTVARATDTPSPRSSVSAVVAIMHEVASTEIAELDGAELLALLTELDATARLTEASRAKVLAAVEHADTWRAQGHDPSFAAWRSRTARTGKGRAMREVTTAQKLERMPGAADALRDGTMTPEHAEVLARVATTGDAEHRAKVADALADPVDSAILLESASRLDAPRFARAAQSWAARLDPLALEKDHEAQRRSSYLSISDTPAGTMLRGQLDLQAGHRLRLALEAVTPVPSEGDDRDPAQRAADALDLVAHGVLADPGSKPGAHVPPHVSLVMTAETLAGIWQLERGQEHRDFAPATLEDGTPVPPSETARILCDAQITRIVLDAESVPIDLGRTKRLWSGAQRRLVIARDRHCAFDGCEIPARWCEIHHIDWWARDHGRTDIDNAVLLCSAHHGAVHRDGLRLTRSTAPPGPPGAGLPLVSYTVTRRVGNRSPALGDRVGTGASGERDTGPQARSRPRKGRSRSPAGQALF